MNDTTNNIQMIPVAEIFPHKDNPRKDLGDLTELSDSIKHNGILQNLTVVKKYDANGHWDPDAPAYTVIIGHRRLAAAKIAGVLEVPCVVANMTDAQQFNTMMEENMQRTDLTLIEQADGFQYMLDLGQSKEEISEKTGFSRTTIDRRLKLRQLDREKLKESQDRGATLFDYMELFKIDDQNKRDQLLDTIGTEDFKNNLKRAYDEQEINKRKKAVMAKVTKFSRPFPDKKSPWTGEWDEIARYSLTKDEDIQIPKEASVAVLYYYSTYQSITIYAAKPKPKKEKKPEIVAEYIAWQKQKKAAIKDTLDRHEQLRAEFWKGLSEAKLEQKDLQRAVITFLVQCISGYCIPNTSASYSLRDNLKELTGWEDPYTSTSENQKAHSAELEKEPLRYAMMEIIACFKETTTTTAYLMKDVEYKYSDKYPLQKFEWCNGWWIEKMTYLYNFLSSIGYQASNEELSILNGNYFDHINDDAPQLPMDGKEKS